MKLFVGLGNPGPKYAGNRHNIGFMALDRIAADHGFSPWKGKFQGSLCEGRLGREKLLLLKPETFMNLSGQSVGEAMRFYKLTPDDVVVFHDELDLAPGKLKVKKGGGHAGHNGLRSIHQHIGETYLRVRMGIGHPGRKELVSPYVLHDFHKADADWLEDELRGISEGAAHLAEDENAKFSNAVALRLSPQRPSNSSDNRPQSAKAKPQNAAKAPAPAPAASPMPTKAPEPAPTPEPDSRSALQKLMDKFS